MNGELDKLTLIIAGAILGIAIALVFDPPPEEVIQAIAQSKWARRLAEAYVSENLPPEEREKLINEIARAIAEKAWIRLTP